MIVAGTANSSHLEEQAELVREVLADAKIDMDRVVEAIWRALDSTLRPWHFQRFGTKQT